MKKSLAIIFGSLVIFYLFTSLFAQESRPVPEKSFTVEELAEFNGTKGKKGYIAVDGIVYDVTENSSWKNGKHKRGLRAGKDHSGMLSKSPHGRSVLNKLPIVGTLKK